MNHNPESIRHFEQSLRHQERQLEASMLSAVVQGREVTSHETQDVADQAVQSYQKELLFRQSSTGHEQLALVRGALERIREGSFGPCQYCDKPIGVKRLEALPWTPACIDCQEKIESGELEGPVRAA